MNNMNQTTIKNKKNLKKPPLLKFSIETPHLGKSGGAGLSVGNLAASQSSLSLSKKKKAISVAPEAQ